MSRSRVPAIARQGTSGSRICASRETFFAASPMISTGGVSARLSWRSVSRSSRVRARTKRIALRAASSMCCSRTRSSGRDILILGFPNDSIPEVATERSGCVQVDATANQCRQLVLQIDEGKPRHMTVLEFHEDVDIAIGAEVLSQHGTEKRKPPDVMPSAKIGDALAIDGELLWHLTHANADDRLREARPGEAGSAWMISGRQSLPYQRQQRCPVF